jgi:predicted N-formylglutamate amidohydrolase
MVATASDLQYLRRVMADAAPPFRAVERIEGELTAGVLLICDHARNVVPAPYRDLGLPPEQFQRHIAYDIGAETVTRSLAEQFAAPAVIATFSRLLIDPNRGADDPTLVMRLSDGAIIPGNAAIDETEIHFRTETFWRPYRDAISDLVLAMLAAGPVPAIVAVHSFTESWRGTTRPWHIGVLWDQDPRIAVPFLAALAQESDLLTGDNQPYDGALQGDTLYECATQRGLANLLIEIRQDLVGQAHQARAWADRLGRLLAPVLAIPDAHIVRQYGSRATARRMQRST